MAVLVHELVRARDVVEAERLAEAGVDLAGEDEVVQALRLLVVREVRALEALLPHPEIAQIDGCVVAGRTGANHDHAAGVADEDGRRHGILAGMLEHDARAAALAEDVPQRLPERARARGP